MKFTKIALAVAAIVASQQALAFDAYVSGASALRDAVPQIVDNICQTNSATTPRTMYIAANAISDKGTGTVDNDRVAYTCTLHSSTSNSTIATKLGAAAGKVINLYYSDEPGDNATLDNLLGGSITGIATVATATNGATQAQVNFVTLSSCTTIDTTNTSINAPFVGSTLKDCSAQATHLSQIGVSDVEPTKFDAPYFNLPANVGSDTTIADGWSNFDLSSLTGATTMFVQGFGVAVQTNSSNVPAVTNISRDVLAAILSGAVTNWAQVPGSTSTAPIKVCTRAPGSGTKATFNQLVNRAGCYYTADGSSTGFSTTPVAATNLSSSSVRYADLGNNAGVRENATTGQVQSCMTDGKLASGASVTTGTAPVAIGIIGLDAMAKVASGAGYTAINVDGVQVYDATGTAPVAENGTGNGSQGTRILEANIVTGQYPLWVESTAQLSQVSGAIPAADATSINALYNYIANHSGDTVFTNKFAGIMTLDDFRAGAGGASHTTTRGDMYYTRGGDTCAVAVYQ